MRCPQRNESGVKSYHQALLRIAFVVQFTRLIIAFIALALVGRAAEFRTDVMAVLSKAGCNLGGCHGNGQGKGGFKLSLRGQDPDLDWLALARDQGGRRVNEIEPEQSLILLKATAQIAHEGGKRFGAGDPEYALLLEWLSSGAPDSGMERKLVKLEVSPRERVLVEPEKEARLRAVAKFADGTERDVTRLAVFEPNNLTTHATAEGVITAEKPGEVTVLVRYLSEQVPVHLAFVPTRPDFVWSAPPANNFIDEQVFAKLRTLRSNPSELCSDSVFLRRAYLDLLGVTPSAQTARSFAANTAPDKREKLVEELLTRGEFADFWAMKWADLLKIEERQLDHHGMEVFHGWIRESIAANKPLDQFVREIIAARGSTYQNPPANWWRANRDPVTRAENTSRVFLGVQLNCAQCHNHPFERWTQDDYYNWGSLFARLDYEIKDNKRKDTNDQKEFKGDQSVVMKASVSFANARTGKPATPRFLGGPAPQITKDQDELQALAQWLTQSPMFARMQVNRVWFHLFGRGLVEPVDDFRASNPAAHPALLDALAKDFVAHGCDLRHLIRTVMASRTYQLASATNATNAEDDANFSHALVRRIGAEQFLDSASKALAAPLSIPDWPAATRIAQVPEGRKHYHPINAELDRFELVFGKPPRLVASECERTNEPTVGQAFQLISGRVVQDFLTRKDNVLAAAKDDPRAFVGNLVWALLSRAPTDAEADRFAKYLTDAKDKRQAAEDLAWSLLNAKEFLFRQ